MSWLKVGNLKGAVGARGGKGSTGSGGHIGHTGPPGDRGVRRDGPVGKTGPRGSRGVMTIAQADARWARSANFLLRSGGVVNGTLNLGGGLWVGSQKYLLSYDKAKSSFGISGARLGSAGSWIFDGAAFYWGATNRVRGSGRTRVQYGSMDMGVGHIPWHTLFAVRANHRSDPDLKSDIVDHDFDPFPAIRNALLKSFNWAHSDEPDIGYLTTEMPDDIRVPATEEGGADYIDIDMMRTYIWEATRRLDLRIKELEAAHAVV